MSDRTWEDALESVVAFLEAPPPPNSDEGRAFDEALRRVLAAAPSEGLEGPAEEDAAAGLDSDLRARLDDLALRRAGANPFGDHPDGIGPTLGMDLSGA
ncbi:MAG TPA: hypothetical protein VN157_12600 [Caulobacter sp.]|nr:hypothetical protein [Caulobacter sp.]